VAQVSQITENQHKPFGLEWEAVDVDCSITDGWINYMFFRDLVGEERGDDCKKPRYEFMVVDDVGCNSGDCE